MEEQLTLQVVKGKYPFGYGPCLNPPKVQEQHKFTSESTLKQKKQQMIKKSEMVTNPSIIRLNGIAQHNLTLSYMYEFVPHSVESYLRNKKQIQPNDIWKMTKSLLVKKMAYELTMLISYLAKMRIETDLSLQTLGISHDEKLKLYVSPKSKMGIKPEIQLIVTYGHAKETINRELQNILSHLDNQQPFLHQSVPTKARKMQRQSEQPFLQPPSETMKTRVRSIPKLDSDFSSRLRQTRTFKESNDYRKRKMSTGGFDLDSDHPKFGQRPQRGESIRSSRYHKYSYQQMATEPDIPHSYPSFPSQPQPEEEGVGISQSKSIRIELEQTNNPNEKRKRKDSYKVKITTFREYQVEGSPTDLFGVDPNAKEEDLFDYFAKKAKKQQDQECQGEQYQKQEEWNVSSEEHSSDKNRKETGQTNFTNAMHTESNSRLQQLESRHRASLDASVGSKKLEDRIRQAKQRTNKALNMIKALKK